jgi:hypothetical protein
MKRLIQIVLFTAIFFASLVAYAGDYDGLWSIQESGEINMVRQNQQSLLVVDLKMDTSPPHWKALFGTISGNQGNMQSFFGDRKIESWNVIFTSLTTAEATCLSCVGDNCTPPGTVVHLNKLF